MIRKISLLMMPLVLTACTSSLTGGQGLGGDRITLVDASELPGPNGQTGSDHGYVHSLGPYDRLVLDVMGFSELRDRKVQVDGSGTITLPIAGTVDVGGLTTTQAVDRITAQLRQGHVRNPQVAVNLEESRSQYITLDGEVGQPGNYPIVAGMTLMRAVAAARGANEFARLEEVVIHRNVNGQPMVALYSLSAIRRGNYPDPVVYPQDIVVVGNSPSRRLFQNILMASPLFMSPLVAILRN